MRLALLQIYGNASKQLIAELRSRGYLVDVVSEDRTPGRTRQTVAIVPVSTAALSEFLRLVSRFGGSLASLANTDLPPLLAPEYHIGGSTPSIEGGVSIFLFRVRRYERIH